MGKKFLSLIIVPHTKTSSRTLSFSKRTVKVVRVGTIALAVLMIGLMADYVRIRLSGRSYQTLTVENARQKEEIQTYQATIGVLEKRLDSFAEYAGKLNVFAGIKSPDAIPDGVGGPSRDEQLSQAVGALPQVAPPQLSPSNVQSMTLRAEDVEKNLGTLVRLFENKTAELAVTPSIWPARGYASSGFGWRADPFTGQRAFHAGLDIATSYGNPVVATADGTVMLVSNDRMLGQHIVINHGNGYTTLYGHMSKTLVRPGQRLRRGTEIGKVGHTGKALGDHVHYEVRKNANAVNPYQFILEEETVAPASGRRP